MPTPVANLTQIIKCTSIAKIQTYTGTHHHQNVSPLQCSACINILKNSLFATAKSVYKPFQSTDVPRAKLASFRKDSSWHIVKHCDLQSRNVVKKLIEKSKECHNHKPQPIPDAKRKSKNGQKFMHVK